MIDLLRDSIDQLAPWLIFLLPLIVIDLVLKAWSMWRAARMNKAGWFVALLLINSLGIVPLLFLYMTNTEYNRRI